MDLIKDGAKYRILMHNAELSAVCAELGRMVPSVIASSICDYIYEASHPISPSIIDAIWGPGIAISTSRGNFMLRIKNPHLKHIISSASLSFNSATINFTCGLSIEELLIFLLEGSCPDVVFKIAKHDCDDRSKIGQITIKVAIYLSKLARNIRKYVR